MGFLAIVSLSIRASLCRCCSCQELHLHRSSNNISLRDPPASQAKDASYMAKGQEISRVDSSVTAYTKERLVRWAVQGCPLATQLARSRGLRSRGEALLGRVLRSAPAHFPEGERMVKMEWSMRRRKESSPIYRSG